MIILSVIMASVSVQIMVEAVQTIYNMAANDQGPPTMSNLTIGLVASTIGKPLLMPSHSSTVTLSLSTYVLPKPFGAKWRNICVLPCVK